jgi:hypothetical protein
MIGSQMIGTIVMVNVFQETKQELFYAKTSKEILFLQLKNLTLINVAIHHDQYYRARAL